MYLKQCLVTSNVEYFKGDVQEIIKSHKTIKQWAYILHDKDDTAKHYHIYLNFGSSGVDTKQVGEWFGLQESQVEKIKGRKTDALQYLTHADNKQKYKYQYSQHYTSYNYFDKLFFYMRKHFLYTVYNPKKINRYKTAEQSKHNKIRYLRYIEIFLYMKCKLHIVAHKKECNH